MNNTPPTPPYGGMKEQSLITEVLGYSPRIRILDYLLDFPTNDFTKKEIIEALGMSKQTFYKYFDSLEKYRMVKVSRTIGKAKLYQIDSGNELVKAIKDLEKKMSLQIAEQELGMEQTVPAE
ncbi:MAG: winged helix-turn-helix domain-containing protein [Nitrosopumilaceae archaeon]